MTSVIHVVEAALFGSGRHVLDLAEYQLRSGRGVTICWSPERSTDSFVERAHALQGSGLKLVELSMTRHPSGQNLSAARAVRKLARSTNSSIIHGHSAGGGTVARLAAFGSPLRAVYTPNGWHSMSPTTWSGARLGFVWWERLMTRISDGLIAVSPEELAYAERTRLAPALSQMVSNGVDPLSDDEFGVGGLAGDSMDAVDVIGFVGRFCDQKRPALAIEAYRELMSRDPDRKLRLALVGQGPQEPGLLEMLEELNGTFPGADAARYETLDGPAVMSEFSVLVVPSAYEGFPYVVLEALHAGTPVVVSTKVPVRAFQGESYGVVVAAQDTAVAFADALDHTLREVRRRSSVQQTAAAFTIDQMGRRTDEHYAALDAAPAATTAGHR